MLDRRTFLIRTGLALGTGVLAAGCRPRLELVRGATVADLQDWQAVRGEFNLSRDYIHLTGFLLASHCLPVLKDRKSTRLNSSHVSISYAVFCLKKKIKKY